MRGWSLRARPRNSFPASGNEGRRGAGFTAPRLYDLRNRLGSVNDNLQLCHFFDRGIDLAKPPVEVGDRVGLDIDPSCERRVLGLDGRRRRATLPRMGGNELRVNARGIDDGQAGDKRHEHKTPDPGRCAPPAGEPSDRELRPLHGYRHGDDGQRCTWKQHRHAAD